MEPGKKAFAEDRKQDSIRRKRARKQCILPGESAYIAHNMPCRKERERGRQCMQHLLNECVRMAGPHKINVFNAATESQVGRTWPGEKFELLMLKPNLSN